MPDTDRNINVCIDEIDIAVGLQEPNSYLRILRQKLIDNGQQTQARNLHWSCNDKLASGGREFTRRTTLLFVNLLQDLLSSS